MNHHEASAEVSAPAAQVFAFLDDPKRLAGHMEKSGSPMMAGGSMAIETDAQRGQAIGSRIRLSGRVLGLKLWLDEAVTEYAPPRHKAWETLGEPRLLVVGPYRMGFDLEPTRVDATRVRLWIDHDLPPRGLPRLLGRLLGGFYARWCVEQMLGDCRKHFAGA